jgi:hypothetical protein
VQDSPITIMTGSFTIPAIKNDSGAILRCVDSPAYVGVWARVRV